jgi:hypothetical protein
MASPVLLSWVAVNNDPYERERESGAYRRVNGDVVPGPTLTLLFDEESPFAGQIKDVVLLFQRGDGSADQHQRRAVEDTESAIKERNPDIRVHHETWSGDDPTDHRSIFEFLRSKLPELRRQFSGRELVIHISPGTPSMQIIWVLMAETGFVEPPFRIVKSYRKGERRGRCAVVSVEVGIETFYKVYKTTRPAQIASDEQRVSWDPAKFRTSRLCSLFAEARRFAQLNVPVLLLGERGTGKTTLAGWIRLHSPYRREEQDSHWTAVACGQYNPETMRAELFGYMKGAFTGAMDDREGLLAAADRDTLFLDEVGDVSRDLQRLLIKALEEKIYLPLGGDKTRTSSFRLLTATNLDPEELRCRLDPDFLDRISLLKLQIPPLREIREELCWLWETTYEQAIIRSGVPRNVGIAKGDVDRIFGDRGSIGSEVRLGVRPLVHTETEVVPPQLPAVCPIKAERQQRLLAALRLLGSHEHAPSIDHRRASPPAWESQRPADVLRLAPTNGQITAVRHAVRVRPSPARPVGRRRCRLRNNLISRFASAVRRTKQQADRR